MIRAPVCGECGAPMALRETKKFFTKDGKPRKFYGCTQFPKCKGTHGAHPNGEPMGIPADKDTKAARQKAHEALDDWMERADLKEAQVYDRLKEHFGFGVHLGEADMPMCKAVIEFAENQ